MPELLRLYGLRFLFYANEHEPMHIHVVKGKGNVVEYAKFNLAPVELIENNGLSTKELKQALDIINQNADLFIERWIEYFNN